MINGQKVKCIHHRLEIGLGGKSRKDDQKPDGKMKISNTATITTRVGKLNIIKLKDNGY